MNDVALPGWFWPAAAAATGLVFGSFLNVLVYRLPLDLPWIAQRSFCPHCKAEIHWYDNIPVLSACWLRFKCRACTGPISWRYPAIELATAGLFAAAILRFGPGWSGLQACALLFFCLALGIIDADYRLLPDSLTLTALFLGLVSSALDPGGDTLVTPAASLLGAFGCAALLLMLYLAYRWLRGVEGMGLGDPKLFAAIGAYLGFWRAMIAVLAAAIAGILWEVLRRILSRTSDASQVEALDSAIPDAPLGRDLGTLLALFIAGTGLAALQLAAVVPGPLPLFLCAILLAAGMTFLIVPEPGPEEEAMELPHHVALPFGTFLAIGAAVALFFGDDLLRLYMPGLWP